MSLPSRILAGAVVALLLLSGFLWRSRDGLVEQVGTLTARNKTLEASIMDEQSKRLSLAGEMIRVADRLAAEQASSAVLQEAYLEELQTNDRLDAEAAEMADQLRQSERRPGDEIPTFDSRGVR